jgi:hypothetical protein
VTGEGKERYIEEGCLEWKDCVNGTTERLKWWGKGFGGRRQWKERV